jgi:hypothetical protein
MDDDVPYHPTEDVPYNLTEEYFLEIYRKYLPHVLPLIDKHLKDQIGVGLDFFNISEKTVFTPTDIQPSSSRTKAVIFTTPHFFLQSDLYHPTSTITYDDIVYSVRYKDDPSSLYTNRTVAQIVYDFNHSNYYFEDVSTTGDNVKRIRYEELANDTVGDNLKGIFDL